MMGKVTYKKSGVDIAKADEFVKRIRSQNQGSLEAFGSFFDISKALKTHKKPFLVSSTDGVGTKLKVAQAVGIHDTVGIDLVAMNVNDIICVGARPLFFLDYIACGKINVAVLSDVVKGIQKGLRDAACALVGGETAEMPGMYQGEDYDLAGFCVGIVDKPGIIDGSSIRPQDAVIGIASSGLHSNGFSLVRKVFGKKGVVQHASKLLVPTRIYVKPVLSLLDDCRASGVRGAVKGIAHMTGGAFYTKATKIMPQGLGMVIDKKSWRVPSIFKAIQKKASLDDKEMYSVLNMGIGMIVVVDRRYLSRALKKLSAFYPAYHIGEVRKDKQKMVLL